MAIIEDILLTDDLLVQTRALEFKLRIQVLMSEIQMELAN